MSDPLAPFVFLAPFASVIAAGAILSVFVVVWSLVRRWPVTAGLSALAWSLLIWLIAGWIAGYVQDPNSARGFGALVGAVLTGIVAVRGGYRLGWSWLWLLIPIPLVWFIFLWRRNNTMQARSRTPASAPPAPVAPTLVSASEPHNPVLPAGDSSERVLAVVGAAMPTTAAQAVAAAAGGAAPASSRTVAVALPLTATAGVFCTKCGAPMAADDVFCRRCGAAAVARAAPAVVQLPISSGLVALTFAVLAFGVASGTQIACGTWQFACVESLLAPTAVLGATDVLLALVILLQVRGAPGFARWTVAALAAICAVASAEDVPLAVELPAVL